MSDSVDKSTPSPAERGQEAWKAAKARIADRNDEVRKAGKQSRDAYQREKEHRRVAGERREQAHLLDMNEQRSK